jgi:hypothetical protein
VILTFASHTVLCKLLIINMIRVHKLVVAKTNKCARLAFPQHGAGCIKATATVVRISRFPQNRKFGLYVFHKLWKRCA